MAETKESTALLAGQSLRMTERPASLATLRESEEKFRLLFEHAPLGIGMTNSDATLISYANPALCRMLGYTAEELSQKTVLDITHPDDAAVTLAGIGDLVTGTASHYSAKKRYLHKDGHVIWANVVGAAVRDAEDRLSYVIGIAEDITERREAERLRIERLEHQRDVLVREVHHRIKNNLQGIIGLIEQLQRKHPEAADALEEAAGQIGAIAVVHGLHGTAMTAGPGPGQLVKSIVESVARLSKTPIECRQEDESSERAWRINDRDIVSIALTINELLYNAVKHGSAVPAAGIEVVFGSQESAFGVLVRNRPAILPPGFDFAAGAGLGTGLALVSSLLPTRGARLSIRQMADAVEASLELTYPCVKPDFVECSNKEISS